MAKPVTLTNWIGLRVSDEDYDYYKRASEALDVPITQVIRDAAHSGRPAIQARIAGIPDFGNIFDAQYAHTVQLARTIVSFADSLDLSSPSHPPLT